MIQWVPATIAATATGTDGIAWWAHKPCGLVATSPSVNRAPVVPCMVCDPGAADLPAEMWSLLYVRFEDEELTLVQRQSVALASGINELIKACHDAGMRCPITGCADCFDWKAGE